MKKATLAIAVAAMAVFSFSSCKKDDDNNNGLTGRSAQIVGTWKQTEYGSDINANGTWDASEKNPTTAANAVTLVFNGNGTGTISQSLGGQSLSGTTTWSLINNENDIRIVVTAPIIGTETLTYNIVSFTSQNVIVRDTSTTPVDYESYTKQ